jgi:hypothetical protein
LILASSGNCLESHNRYLRPRTTTALPSMRKARDALNGTN